MASEMDLSASIGPLLRYLSLKPARSHQLQCPSFPMQQTDGASLQVHNLGHIGAKQTPPRVDKVPYIHMLKENNFRKGFFEHDQFLALRDAMPGHLKGFVTFGYKVGWRISEISNLTWSQVDLKQGIVRLEAGETKNHEARTVYLDDELQEIFGQQRKLRKKLGTTLPYVFLNHDGTDRVKRFDKAWRTACKKAKIGVRLFHDFRRTAVRNMVRAGVPERVAMMISGHKTRAVFDRCTIL